MCIDKIKKQFITDQDNPVVAWKIFQVDCLGNLIPPIFPRQIELDQWIES